VSWQIIPRLLPVLFADPDREAANRAMEAMMAMQKINIAELQRAFDGA
jgi:predicted 3-demethylubiquinone-9 3-methyltransferase (glyoxalase superfamily)